MHRADDEYRRPWMRPLLWAAGVYNLAWGGAMIFAPRGMLSAMGLGDLGPVALAFWQGLGMVIGVFGVGYALAARNPLRHWPVVLAGLLGKVLGPIGSLGAWHDGIFPLSFAWTSLPNDVLWWVPFSMILLAARRAHRAGLNP